MSSPVTILKPPKIKKTRVRGAFRLPDLSNRLPNSKSTSESSKELAAKIDSTIDLLTGQIEGLKLAVQAVEDAGASNESFITSMAQMAQEVSHCGEVCKAAVNAVPARGTATYNSVKAFDDARFMMGSTNLQPIAGGSTRVFGEVVGRDRSRVWIGDADPKTALSYMNG